MQEAPGEYVAELDVESVIEGAYEYVDGEEFWAIVCKHALPGAE